MAGQGETHAHPMDRAAVAAAQAVVPPVGEARELAGLLAVLADGTRARVLFALREVERLCVGDVAVALGISDDAAGYALRVLRQAGMIASRKHGRLVFYELAEGFPVALLDGCLRELLLLSRATGAPPWEGERR